MRRINTDILVPGDIILTTSEEKPSRLIRAVTSSDISHAMICVSIGSVMDATTEGVHARNVEKIFYPEECAIYILRPDPPIIASDLKKVIDYVRVSGGTQYTNSEAVASLVMKKGGTNKQYCSRLVARAYEAAGRTLVDSPDFCSPESLKRSNSLKLIEPSSLPVEAGLTDSLEQEVDNTKGMREVTNVMLKNVRKISPGVQTIDDLVTVSIKHPELDQELAKQLEESGYLTFWKTEVEGFPWRYDEVLIVQYYHSLIDKSSLLDYCKRTLDDDAAGSFCHWSETLNVLLAMHHKHKRRTLKLLCELYVILNRNHAKRLVYANLILRVYG